MGHQGGNMKIGYSLIATIVFLFSVSIPAKANDINTEAFQGHIYKAQSIEKPDEFVNLQSWAEDRCRLNSIPYIKESFFYLTIESGIDQGKESFEYITKENGLYYRNIIADDGTHLNLYSIADPELQSFFIDAEDIYFSLLTERESSASAGSCSETYRCNCVLWVRNCRASWLPTGMTYIWEKKSKINATSPKSGRVAVHDVYYPFGHVSYVKDVNGSKITIEEANHSKCKVTSRTKKPSEMSVIGYIKR